MRHQSPMELKTVATLYSPTERPRMSRQERIERWAELLEAHGGPLNALREIEYLSATRRRAYRDVETPLAIAFADQVLREEGLKSDRLGDALDFFGMDDRDAHNLLCDCVYLGSMTGKAVAKRVRRHLAREAGTRPTVMQSIGRFFGFAM
jgi:hypothetical protein